MNVPPRRRHRHRTERLVNRRTFACVRFPPYVEAQTDASSRVSDECAVNSRWRTTKAASDVEAGFDRLFEDSKRWQAKSKVKPPRPVTGIMRYKGTEGGVLEPAAKLPEDERLSRLLKQYYKHGPIRQKNRKKLFATYLGELTAKEKEIMGFSDEPEMPDEAKLQELAERELSEIERLKREQQAGTLAVPASFGFIGHRGQPQIPQSLRVTKPAHRGERDSQDPTERKTWKRTPRR